MSFLKFAAILRVNAALLFALAFSLATSIATHAAITQLGTPASAFQSAAGNVHSLTNVTVPAGTDRVLIVTASHAGYVDVTSVSFGASPMIKAVERDDTVAVDSIWFLRLGSSASPSTATITATFATPSSGQATPATQSFISAVTYAGVDQTVSVNNPQSAQPPSGSNVGSSFAVASASGNLVFDIFDGFNTGAAVTETPSAGQTLLVTGAGSITGSGAGFARYSTSTKPGAASTTMAWTSNSQSVLHVAVNIIASATPSADLSITKTNGTSTSHAGGTTTYTIVASNAGPDAANSATIADTFPAACTAVNWTCVGAGGGTCSASGSGNINSVVNLPAGGSTTFTAVCSIAPLATGTLANTATVTSAVADPNPGNNSATDSDIVIAQPNLSISDVSLSEGDGGATNFTFTVSLSAPAGPGGVTFDIATADGTGTAGSDYVARSLTAQTIAAGSSTYSFTVIANGDTTPEANETFFVNLTNVTGASVSDGQGLGTIQNDDVSIVQIHDIQGSGLTSPLNGAVVTTEGIVTAQKFNNGFFLQTADANVDADPNTSQGIFVFTSTAPPSTATVGNRVRVTGTVTEFTPATNLNQRSITQLTSPTIVVLSTGNPLPAPVALTVADFSAMSNPDTAEKFEGMRVTIGSARVVEPSGGNITEASASSSTTGVFHVVLDGVARPFREPGIGVMDVFPIPGGKTPSIFDTNPERIAVLSRGQVSATAIAVDADATISNMTGVLDYSSGTWALLPDAGSGTVSGGKTPLAVSDAAPNEVTIASVNLQRFFDEVNDGNGATTLTAAALDKRLTKASIAICDFVKAPHILGVTDVENLRVLGLLADRINSTCASAPQYVPYLVQGNDVGGINVGFLVNSRSVGSVNRVEVLEVTQFGKTTTLVNPDTSTSLLNDRPPLLLRAIVNADNGVAYPVTVIVNHLRSMSGVNDTGPGPSGWPTEGARVRAKRGEQAMFLANLIQTRQAANPSERIVVLGDFNAHEFNDGYVDVMGILRGNAAAASSVIADYVSPITQALTDSASLIANSTEKYSEVSTGSAQSLTHILVNAPVVAAAPSIRVEHARINADFGVHNYGVAGNAIRISSRDPIRVAIATAPPISVNPATLANGTVGVSYSETLSASGGTGAYGFAVTSGALPGGLTLAANGAITGTPNTVGPFNFTITATDSSPAPGPFSGSRAYTVNIAQGTQTVTFAPASPVVFGVTPITLTATATSGLTAFTFSTSSANTICTVTGNQLTIVGVGTCALTATQPGNANYATASANANVVIDPASQTVTFAPASPVNVGAAPITLTATATSGLSAFTFSTSSASTICTVVGNQLTIVGVGTCALTATQPGDANYASASASANVVINVVAPGAPTGVSAVAGNSQATISFTPPIFAGGAPITSYSVSCTPSAAAPTTGGASPIVVTGLTNGVTYSCTVVATNSAGNSVPSSPAQVTPTFRSYVAPAATGTGTISASFTGGGDTCNFSVARYITLEGHAASPPAGSAPAGISFPHGLFDFTTTGCTPGATIAMTIVYPQPLPPGTQYWKYGPTPTNASPNWYVLPATFSGNTVTFSITDGQLGDDDLQANGTIVDQGGPGVPPAMPVPIAAPWYWALLLFMAIVGVGRSRGSRPRK